MVVTITEVSGVCSTNESHGRKPRKRSAHRVGINEYDSSSLITTSVFA